MAQAHEIHFTTWRDGKDINLCVRGRHAYRFTRALDKGAKALESAEGDNSDAVAILHDVACAVQLVEDLS